MFVESSTEPDPFALVSGETVMARRGAGNAVTMTSGVVRLSYFKAVKSETVLRLGTCSTATAAGPTPALCRMGIYLPDPDSGDVTLIASTVNDTDLWASGSTRYWKALSADWDKVAGTWYAFAALCVTGTTAPTLQGFVSNGENAIWADAPVSAMARTGQTDLPSSISFANLTGNPNHLQGWMSPLAA